MKIFNSKKMKEFIVYEALVESETKQQNNTDIIIVVVCRKVKAINQEEAIGKFVLDTLEEKCIKRLGINIVELNYLKSIGY
jgi:hypothetical protein